MAESQQQLLEAKEARASGLVRIEQIASLEASLSGLQSELRALRDGYAKAKEDLSTATARLDEEKKGRGSERAALTTTQAALDRTQQDLVTANEAKGTAEARVERIPSLETRLTQVQGDVVALRGQLTEALQDNASLSARVKTIAPLEADLEAERERQRLLHGELTASRSEGTRLQTQLEEANRQVEAQATSFERLESRFREAFQALSAEALKGNNQAFLHLARATLAEFQQGARTDLEGRQKAIDQAIAPVKDALAKFDLAIQSIEKERAEAFAGLREQIVALKQGQSDLHVETASLVNALRAPSSRGRWGEYQLRRVVELAGMVENCDFTEQAHLPTEEGRLRPDVIVHLPGNKTTVIDAKAPLLAYLEALDAKDEPTRRAHIRDHARQLKVHITQLGSKAYWDQLPSSPDFVVMYVPLESAFAAALQEDPGLIDYAVECSVIPCGPMTLLTHLKAATYGWRQERIAANEANISALGKQLYDRLSTLASHISDVGKHLGKAAEAYNAAVGSLERRVLISARKFKDYGAATGDDLPEPTVVETAIRNVQMDLPGEVPETPGEVQDPEDKPS